MNDLATFANFTYHPVLDFISNGKPQQRYSTDDLAVFFRLSPRSSRDLTREAIAFTSAAFGVPFNELTAQRIIRRMDQGQLDRATALTVVAFVARRRDDIFPPAVTDAIRIHKGIAARLDAWRDAQRRKHRNRAKAAKPLAA